jgi:RimJ/RimL family protein N-acetyltransferase
MTILATARLDLRPWEDTDLVLLAGLSADPAVIRWVGDGQPWTRERCTEVHARTLLHWETHGFGWRVATVRETDQPIGFIALNFAFAGTRGVGLDEYEIGWWLSPAVWRRGYASEGAAAVRDEALQRLHAPSVIARIQPDNAASRAVAESIGMAVDFSTADHTGIPVVVYRVRAPDATRVSRAATGSLPPP